MFDKKIFSSPNLIFTCILFLLSFMLYTPVYAETPKDKTLTLSGFVAKGDFSVASQYETVILNDVKIAGEFKLNNNSNPINIIIDKDSSIGTIIVNSQTNITNNGYIKNLNVRKSINLLGTGSIDYAVVQENSNITNQISVCIDFSENTVLDKQPESLYKNGKKIVSNSNKIKPGSFILFENNYYFNESLDIVNGIVTINDKKFIYNVNGNQAGLFEISDDWYLCDAEGEIKIGLQEYNENTYFFDNDGKMRKGYVDIDAKKYYFNDEGKMIKNEWVDAYKAQYNGELYYTRTGNEEVDAELDALVLKITGSAKTEKDKMLAVYKWMPANFHWRVVPADISGGYTDAKVLELGIYALDNMRGSCEQFASLEGLILRRMGYPTEVISGRGLHSGVEHSWIRINIDGSLLHFDPQYESTYMRKQVLSNFLKTDEEFKKTHKW